MRSLAELENTRKRAARDRSEALKFGAMSFARDMLGVVDNLQRALKVMQELGDDMPDATRSLLEGVAATERDLLAALARHKVTALTPMGEKFDPNLHEAMFEAPGTGQEKRHDYRNCRSRLYDGRAPIASGQGRHCQRLTKTTTKEFDENAKGACSRVSASLYERQISKSAHLTWFDFDMV